MPAEYGRSHSNKPANLNYLVIGKELKKYKIIRKDGGSILCFKQELREIFCTREKQRLKSAVQIDI